MNTTLEEYTTRLNDFLAARNFAAAGFLSYELERLGYAVEIRATVTMKKPPLVTEAEAEGWER
jgi:hypothetical protein